MRIASILVASALAAPAILSADDATESTSGFYLAPQVNAVRTEERAVDDGAAATLAAGFELNPEWNLEANLFHGRFDGEQANDLKMDALGINALRVFRRRARLSPLLLLGAGALRKDLESGASSTDAYGDAGIGLLVRLRESAADGRALFARFDARARYDDAGSRLDRLFGIGLQYAFGGRTAQPLPTPQPTPVAAPPTDNDGDGVVDADDRCPGTPAGKTVGADGCEPDSDHDGVPDSRPDTCQDTPAGTRVDTSGCTLGRAIQLPLVTFENDSDRLESTAFAALDAAIETLRMNADLSIEVAGHSDSRSSDAYNLDLSRRRAEAVRRYLVDHGVTNALTSQGYGESEPVAHNDTAAGRAQNRRVVLRILSR